MKRFGLVLVASALVSASAFARQITRVSVSSNGEQGNYASSAASISADGRFVAFVSFASNLDPIDANGRSDVFVRDRASGVTERVSVDSAGVEGNADSRTPAISADGRFVAFVSNASNLVSSDLYGYDDIFVHDRLTGVTERVSIDPERRDGLGQSSSPSISADGRFVAFSSSAPNLVPGETNSSWDVFVRDRVSGVTERVSVNSSGAQGNGDSGGGSISLDGRFVAFASFAPLVADDTNSSGDVFVRDRTSNLTERVSVDSAGHQGNNYSGHPSISADGRFVAFASGASNLVAGDTNANSDVFVHDRTTGVTDRVSVDSEGVQANLGCNSPSISADGLVVSFWTSASNFVPGDTRYSPDVFVRDRARGLTERLSQDSAGNAGDRDSFADGISADGRFVAFQSNATNLVPDDTNETQDVFVFDRNPPRVTSVAPGSGSEAGDDLVHIQGEAFTTLAETTVRFGDAAATVLEVLDDRITARTPPGVGVSDVSVRNSRGVETLAGGYRYVAPELAARYGNVNVARGDRENVLLVNGLAGDGLRREIPLAVGEPVQAIMVAPSSRPSARFVLYLWGRAPTVDRTTVLPRGLGSMVFAPPFVGGSPPVIWNNAGHLRALGTPTLPSRPAPSFVFRSSGVPAPISTTLQGLIEDSGSRIPEGWSVTNAVVLQIR